MSEVPPILTDKAAEQAFLINQAGRLVDHCLHEADACAKRAARLRGLAAFICRMRGRAWVRRASRHYAFVETQRLGL